MFPSLLSASLVIAAASGPQSAGPQVGDPLPAFDLPDQNGRRQSLATLARQNGLVVVFFRSADW